MWLLGTNVVSELRKGRRADPNVNAWTTRTPARLSWISVKSLLEIEIGVLRMERRDAKQGARLRRWLDETVPAQLEGRILPIDADICRICANLHVPDPRPERDALIAATALAHGLTVVTRNTADFKSMGVTLINPWQGPGSQ